MNRFIVWRQKSFFEKRTKFEKRTTEKEADEIRDKEQAAPSTKQHRPKELATGTPNKRVVTTKVAKQQCCKGALVVQSTTKSNGERIWQVCETDHHHLNSVPTRKNTNEACQHPHTRPCHLPSVVFMQQASDKWNAMHSNGSCGIGIESNAPSSSLNPPNPMQTEVALDVLIDCTQTNSVNHSHWHNQH